MVTVNAIAKELRERGHYFDELYKITITYATSLHVRYHSVNARCEAIELRYQTEAELGPYEYPWLEDDEWDLLDGERSDIEDELEELFNTVIGFKYDCNPFKK